MRQACIAAALCEFLGAVLVGSKVAGTVKNGIISLSVFRGNAGVQLLSFTCALVASATWLMIATHNSWPVSTTYSIVSALAGAGVALGGRTAVQWGWNNAKGLGAIFAGMLIAPLLSAAFASTVYLFTKYAVLERQNSLRAGMWVSPLYFFTVAAVLTMSIGECHPYYSVKGWEATRMGRAGPPGARPLIGGLWAARERKGGFRERVQFWCNALTIRSADGIYSVQGCTGAQAQ